MSVPWDWLTRSKRHYSDYRNGAAAIDSPSRQEQIPSYDIPGVIDMGKSTTAPTDRTIRATWTRPTVQRLIANQAQAGFRASSDGISSAS
jgi:hypothetical protein